MQFSSRQCKIPQFSAFLCFYLLLKTLKQLIWSYHILLDFSCVFLFKFSCHLFRIAYLHIHIRRWKKSSLNIQSIIFYFGFITICNEMVNKKAIHHWNFSVEWRPLFWIGWSVVSKFSPILSFYWSKNIKKFITVIYCFYCCFLPNF